MDRFRPRKSDVASFSPYFCQLSDFRHLLVTYFNYVLDESWSNILHCVWIAVSTITITLKERHGYEEKRVNTWVGGGGVFPNRELTVSGSWADRGRTHDGNTALGHGHTVSVFGRFLTLAYTADLPAGHTLLIVWSHCTRLVYRDDDSL
jgi:hypothetical protein